jgi:hypothetical protein
MISSKTPSPKKLKKRPYSKQSYIFKKKKKVYLRTSRNPSFHPSYQIPLQSQLLQGKSVPTKKDEHLLLIQPKKFTMKKEIRKRHIPSKKKALPPQSFLKKRRQLSSEKVVSFLLRLPRTQQKLSGRQRKFFRLLPNVIYRKRRRRRKTPHQFIRT